ncbi:MAG: serine/threonine protein kinase [Prevotella sp.]|nr:serine/threonine protein kinase [Prevotella sp.]
MNELSIGCLLQEGRYRIDEVLGRGGFGITYRGVTNVTLSGELGHMDVKVQVAIKEFFISDYCQRGDNGMDVIIPCEANSEKVERYKQKFIREARHLASISHPHIVNVTDVFEENDTVYYVMRYLPGGSLGKLVKQSSVGRLTEEEALKYVRQIGDALDYLHAEKHICHLDVKPANILINTDGNAILIDFGISKIFDETGEALSNPSVNYSNNYAPLEQYQPLTFFSPQTDLYSLGATLYFLLTGTPPPEASVLNEDGFPECPYYVTPRVWQLIKKAMEPRRKNRPQTASEWLGMLDSNGNEEEQDDVKTIAGQPDNGETVVEVMTTGDNASRATGGEYTVTIDDEPKAPVAPAPRKSSHWLTVAAVFIGAIAIGALSFYLLGKPSKVKTAENTLAAELQLQQPVSTAEALRLLGTTDITIERIQAIEQQVKHDGSKDEETVLTSRLMALKHLYLEGLMAERHNTKTLRNAYVIHSGELSNEQRQVMVWFFNQPKSVQKLWEGLATPAATFDDFKQKIEQAKTTE